MLAEETIELLFNIMLLTLVTCQTDPPTVAKTKKNDKHSNKLGHNGKQHSLPDYIVALPD